MTALLVWLVCLVCAALWYVLTASAAALTAAAEPTSPSRS